MIDRVNPPTSAQSVEDVELITRISRDYFAG